MTVLLDESVPRVVKTRLSQFDINTILPTNRVPEVTALLPAIVYAINTAAAGTFIEIPGPGGKF